MKLPQRRTESGAMTIFVAAMILPLLVIMVSMGIEIGSVFNSRSIEQKVTDSAALYAVKQLPNKAVALEAAQKYLQTNSETVKKYGLSRATIVTSSDSVSVRLSVPFSFPLARYFNFSGSFNYQVKSQTRIQPKDVVIYFDSSSYMMPANMDQYAEDPDPGAGEWWSELSVNYPAAGSGMDWDFNSFFKSTTLYNPPGPNEWKEATFFRTYNNISVSPRTSLKRTQICFNPPFSALKEAVIRLYYANSQFNLNSVAVETGPSQLDPSLIHIMRPIQRGGFVGGKSEGGIENEAFPGFIWRDRHCLAAAQVAQTSLDAWRASNPSRLLTELPPVRMRHAFPHLSPETDPAILNHNGAGPNPAFANTVNGVLNASLLVNNMSIREAVWSRRAYPYLALDQETSIGIRQIIIDTGLEALQADPRIAERGPLAANVTKQVFILLGNFPRASIGGNMIGYETATVSQRQTIINRMISGLDTLYYQTANLTQPLSIYITMMGRTFPNLKNPVTGADITCVFGQCQEFEDAVSEIAAAITAWEATHPRIRVTFERIMNQVGLPSTWVSHMSMAERQVYLTN